MLEEVVLVITEDEELELEVVGKVLLVDDVVVALEVTEVDVALETGAEGLEADGVGAGLAAGS